MKTKNYYTVILRSDSDEESFEDSSLRSKNKTPAVKIYDRCYFLIWNISKLLYPVFCTVLFIKSDTYMCHALIKYICLMT